MSVTMPERGWQVVRKQDLRAFSILAAWATLATRRLVGQDLTVTTALHQPRKSLDYSLRATSLETKPKLIRTERPTLVRSKKPPVLQVSVRYVCYVFSENVGKEWLRRTSLARHSHGCTKCRSEVCTPSLAVSGCVHHCDSGILAYYPLDDDFNDHCNGFHALPQGGVSINHAMGQNGAANFDGTGKLVLDFFRHYQWGTAFSVSVWFKRTGGFNHYSGVVNNGYATHGSWEIRMGAGSTITHEEKAYFELSFGHNPPYVLLRAVYVQKREQTKGIRAWLKAQVTTRRKATVTTRRTCFCVLSTCKNVGNRTASVRAYERATYGLRESNFTILTCNCCTDSARSMRVPRTVLASSVLTPHFPVDLLNDHAEHTCTIPVYKDDLTGDCQLVSKMPRKAQKKTTRQDPKKRAAEDTRAASDDEVNRRCTHLQRASTACTRQCSNRTEIVRCKHVQLTYHLRNVRCTQPLTARRVVQTTYVGCGIVTSNSPSVWDFRDGSAPSNAWHHAVMTYDGSRLKFYVNNEPQNGNENCCSGPILAKNTPVTIGQAGPGTIRNPEFFNGFIDDVRIYRKALTMEEVAALYARGSGMN
ncbi:hypothetical protein Bbelb_279340 [Branchiostoma belcheri]|nr:hypothetical protein Bbelb_279340 [Branchiostoma belcheri]